jgi:hypothetical protein
VPSDRLITHLPEDWQVEQLRLTLFPSQHLPKPSDWWQGVVGSEPLNESTDRNGFAPVYQATGPLLDTDGFLTLRYEPAKVDWVLGPSPFSSSLPYVTIGAYKNSIESFQKFANRFFAYDPPIINRFALGAVFLLPISTKQEGYKFLDTLLPKVELDPDGSSDFLYRINRSRKSTTMDIRVNRLSEWSVLQIMPQTFITGSSHTQLVSEPLIYLARVSMDINTALEFAEEIDAPHQMSLFAEFIELIDEIAKEGDVY